MKRDGYDQSQPIDIAQIDGQNIIIDGHHRARAAGAAGIKDVPVRVHQVDAATAEKYMDQAAHAAEQLGLSHRWPR